MPPRRAKGDGWGRGGGVASTDPAALGGRAPARSPAPRLTRTPLRLLGGLAAALVGALGPGAALAQAEPERPRPRVEVHEVLYDGVALPNADVAAPPLGRRNLEVRFRPDDDSEPLLYQFRLEGLDEGWVDAGPRTTAYYRDLDPGAYTFHVRARRAGDDWGPTAEIAVLVAGHLWEEPWALTVLALLLAAGLVLAVREQLRRADKRAETLERLVDERTRSIQEEQARTEGALLVARRERSATQAALDMVEEQSVQLLRMDHMKSRLFANLSHEFRTPLTLILDPLDRALDGAFGPLDEAACRSLEGARTNAHRLLHLINQILDLAKLEAGSMELRAREEDLVPLLRQATDMFASEAERRGVDLRFVSAEARLPVWVDAEKVEKVLYNLVTNALKATAPGGKVVVSVRATAGAGPDGHAGNGYVGNGRTGNGHGGNGHGGNGHGGNGRAGGGAAGPEAAGYAEVAVRDTGSGIPEGEVASIFDRFYQTESGRLRSGTGIGLSLVREMVELHRGGVGVESVLGFGSTFCVRLPLGRGHLDDHEVAADPPEAPAAPDAAPQARRLGPDVATTAAAAASDGRGSHSPPERPAPAPADCADDDPADGRPLVLVVEDNPELRELVAGHLRAHYRVAEAAEGGAALRLARECRPALVVSDVLMPGVDGLALCRRLKADDVLGDTPVVLLTAKASSEDRLEALQTGADDFLTKPFAAAELLARAGNLIQSRSAMRGRYSEEVVLPTTGAAVPSADAAFLERAFAVVDGHLGDEGFTVGALAEALGTSESTLKRRLKPLVGATPVEFVRERRLERAAALLLGQAGTVGEVAAQVGFGSPSYFARCFRDRYGVPPSEFGPPEASPEASPVLDE